MTETQLPGDFYIVGIGASAGGLDALERFFSEAPSDSGLAFVVIQHLSPDYKSLMADLLGKRTDMPVHVAEDGMAVEPNHVYLIPPKQSLTIFHQKLYLTDRESGLLYLPIDIFFQSLADDLGEKAIGVILSGTGSDGTRGIRAIKEKGGLVIVQDEQSAKFDGMPRSAVATNLVDYILPPEKMVREALTYIQHPYLISDPAVKRVISHDDDSLSKIFALLRSNSGVDFTYYKQSTMVRRIERRMSIKQIEKLSDYLYLLHQTPSEANTLYREFLIGVTRFFRDAEAFEELRTKVIPAIFENKNRGEAIRVWVAGCSTGEEAYSIAILLTEFMETTGRHMDVKVFATDLDKNALEFAGKGIYPESIAADISPENLQNYFIKSGESYTVTRRVREMVIFAKQNIINDPPFSKVDLISCRNLLIYLQPVLQKKVISAFQFALNPDGYMFLGTSETIGDSDDYFECKHSKWKIFQYKGGFRPTLDDNRLLRTPLSMQPTITRRFATTTHNDWRSVENIQRGMIDAFLPPTAVVDEDLNLIYVSGDMDAYLRVPPGGLFTPNILKQAREGLSVPLSTAIHKVLKDQQEVFYKNIHFGEEGAARFIDLKAKPYTEPASHQKMVLLQFTPVVQLPLTQEPVESFDINTSAQQRIQDLEHELQYTRESLQATVEELETSNEELQATNEELFAANEELQSTNEELHSVNEELITVNAEYHAKIQELTKLNEDINNLLSSTDVGTIFLDRELRIRLFTPTAQQEIHLLDQDVGRPISFVTHNIVDCDLVYESQQVLKTLASREMEVRNNRGRWYQMKLLPYYTLHQQVGGVVITLLDITAFKQAEAARRESRENFERYFNMSTVGMCVTSPEKGWIEVNDCLCTMLGYAREELQRLTWSELTHPEDLDKDLNLFNQVLEGKIDSYQLEKRFIRKDKSVIHTALYVSCQRDLQGKAQYFLASLVDITDRIKAEDTQRKGLEKYQILFDSFPHGITVADKDGKILESNREAERILGLSKEAQAQRKIDGAEWQIIRPDSSIMPAEEYASVRALKENRRVENVVMGIQKSQGDVAWINVAATPLGDYGVLVTYYETKEKPKGSRRK
jgi:two-component system CheB/CheR fusion protein